MMKKIKLFGVAVLFVLLTISSALALAPTITSPAVTVATANTQYTYNVTANDPEAGPLTYALTTAPSGMIISSTGVITWTPSSAQVGTQNVNITVTDNESLNASQAFQINVAAGVPVLSASDAIVGSSTQEREQTATGTWRITNTGTATATNLKVSLSGVNTEYAATAILTVTTLAPGQYTDIPLSAYVPKEEDSGVHNIGQITVTGDGMSPLTKNLQMNVQSMLEITRVKFDMAKAGTDSMTSAGTVGKDAEPDDSIDVTVTVKNLYSSSTDNRMDVDLETTSSVLDAADGLTDSISSVDPGKRDDLTFSFTLDPRDYDVRDEPFDITLKVTGTDDNGAQHTDSWDVRLRLNVESRDVRISNERLATTYLSCTDRTVRVDYTLVNVGRNDLDNAMVNTIIPDLSVSQWNRQISLDISDSRDFSETLTLPSNVKPGTYSVEIRGYSDTGSSDLTDTQIVPFTIKDCATNTGNNGNTGTNNGETGTNTGNGGTTTPPTTVIKTNTSAVSVTGTPVAQSSGSSVFNGTGFIIALAVIVVLLLVVIIVLLVKILR